MVTELLILFSRDSEEVVLELKRQLSSISTEDVCVDELQKRASLSLGGSSSELQIVVFSPQFLKFLECQHEQAYALFQNFDVSTILAVFCSGVREGDVFCYHTAPLKCYKSWPKYQVTVADEGGCSFPDQLLHKLWNVAFKRCLLDHDVETVIVPGLVNRENRNVYIIFPKIIRNVERLSAVLDGPLYRRLILDRVNDCVAKFLVPETLLKTDQTFTVLVSDGTQIVAWKKLRVVQDECADCTFKEKRQLQISNSCSEAPEDELEKQLEFLTNFVDSNCGNDESATKLTATRKRSDSDTKTLSLIELCKKYGLDELSLFIEEFPQQSGGNFQSSEDVCSSQCVALQEESNAADIKHKYSAVESFFPEEWEQTRCSPSPPQTACESDEDTFSSGGVYLNMISPALQATETELPQMEWDEPFCDEEISFSLPSNTYMSMTLRNENDVHWTAPIRTTGNDHQEFSSIAREFLWGRKSIHDIEEQFQAWSERRRSAVARIAQFPNVRSRTDSKVWEQARNSPEAWTFSPVYEMHFCPTSERYPPPLPSRPPPVADAMGAASSPSSTISGTAEEACLHSGILNRRARTLIALCEKYKFQNVGERIVNQLLLETGHAYCSTRREPPSLKQLRESSSESKEKRAEAFSSDPFASGDYACIQSMGLMSSSSSLRPEHPSENGSRGVRKTAENSNFTKQRQGLLKNCLSQSQQELLELMHAFKRGEQTISQVEQQFKTWHSRRVSNPSKDSGRETELQKIRKEYEKAQKSAGTFGLPGIFMRKISKTKVIKEKVSRNRKTDTDLKRTSRISHPSGNSELSDSSKICRPDNQEFKENQVTQVEGESSISQRAMSKKKPPPLPPRAYCRQNAVEEKKLPVQKPKPPPKPKIFAKSVSNMPDLANAKVDDRDKKDCSESFQERPESPGYIIPENLPVCRTKKKYPDPNHVPEKPQAFITPLVCSLSTNKNSSPNRKMLESLSTPTAEKDSISGASKPYFQESVESRHLLARLASHWTKCKQEESRFYIASRRWSSSPNLRNSQPIYMQLLDSSDGRSVSSSDDLFH